MDAFLLRDFDPNQPRDEDGQWSGGGGGGGGKAGGGSRWASLKEKTLKETTKHEKLWNASGGARVSQKGIEGLSIYTGPGSDDINGYLRHGTPPSGPDEDEDEEKEVTEQHVKNWISYLDTAFQVANLAKDVIVYRAFGENTTKRVLSNIGAEFTDKGFVSTTSARDASLVGLTKEISDVKIPIVIRKGAKALPIAHLRDSLAREQEVLIDRGARFAVKKSKKGRVFLELLGHVAKAAVRDFDPNQPRDEDGKWAGGGGGGFAGGKASGKWKSLNAKSIQDSVEKHDAMWKASGGKSIPPKTQSWMREYTMPGDNTGYWVINNSLRKGKLVTKDKDAQEHTMNVIKALDQAFQNVKLSKNTLTYRAVKPKVFDMMLKNMGGEFVDKGFVSTTSALDYAKLFAETTLAGRQKATILPVIIRAGAKALPIAGIADDPSEREVLIDRGARFAVKKSGKGRVYLELLGHVAKAGFEVAIKAALRTFDPNQPRDEGGQWAGEGGSGGRTKGSSAKLQSAPSDRAEWPAHIKALKLPPAWTSVKISHDPKAALQAVGRDAKGRTQYVYSEAFAAAQQGIKFARVYELTQKLNALKAQNADNMKSNDPVKRQLAECMALVMDMGLRPGSNQDTKAATQAFGATTLEGRHVIEAAGKLALQFVGKKGVSLDLPVEDSKLASILRSRAKEAGEGGKLFPTVNERSLLEYSSSLGGGGFKTKDFRTALATTMASALVSTLSRPENVTQFKKMALTVAKAVSRKLGNTPTVALQSYIHPTVFAPWRDHANLR